MADTKARALEREEAREQLRAILPPGTTVYTVLRNVSRSGMTRPLDLYVIEDGAPRRITWSVSEATGYRYSSRWAALEMGGCGMDMGFAAVYGLARSLYPSGFECTGEGCPSNDHSNATLPMGSRVRTAAGSVGTVTESDGNDRGVVTVRFEDDTACAFRVRELEVLSAHHKDGGYALLQRWQ